MGIVDIITTMIDGINLFVTAIQYIFDLITTIFTNFFSVWNFITNGLSMIYVYSQFVPVWLWEIALAWISFRIVIFVKNLGGD